jgi:hypothetical protein
MGMPQATSTFSMARRSSALASVSVLPFSIGDESGEFVEVLFQEHFELEKRLDAVFGRSAAPLGKCGGGGGDGGVDLGGVRQRNFAERGVRGGIDKVLPFGGFGVDPFAGDEMGNANFGNGGGAHGEVTSAVAKSWCDSE